MADLFPGMGGSGDPTKEPLDPMQLAKHIFAKIAGTTPALVTEEGTALKPEDVTR